MIIGIHKDDSYTVSRKNNYIPSQWSKSVSVKFLEQYYTMQFNQIMHNNSLTKQEKNEQIDALLQTYLPMYHNMLERNNDVKKDNNKRK